MADKPFACAFGDCPQAFETAAELAKHVPSHGTAPTKATRTEDPNKATRKQGRAPKRGK